MPFAGLSQEEKGRLALAPHAVLDHVGGADGKVDDREAEALGAWIEATAAAGGFAGDVAAAARAAPVDTPSQGLDGLRALRPLIEQRLDAEEAAALREALIALGEQVAMASGGFLGIGSRVCAAEQVALREIGRALGTLSRRALAAEAAGFTKILLPLDGSPESEAALKPAFDLARFAGAKVTLLEVSTSFQDLSRMIAVDAFVTAASVDTLLDASEAEKQAASSYLAGIKSALGVSDWNAIVREGDPARVIAEEAKAEGADVIIMASVERGALARVFEPSVSEAVLREAGVPVLVVPVGKANRGEG